MTATGWTGEPPEDERPALPIMEMLLSGGRGKRQPGGVLETALARARAAEAREAREAAASAVDPDERAANLVARGVLPGQLTDLARRLGDTLAGLAAEEEKIERGRRRAERVQRDHQAGRISVFDIARMDLDEGDPAMVERLQRGAESLRRQIAELTEVMAPQPLAADPVESATRAAHAAFTEATRQKMEAARAARPVVRPFAFASRGATEHTGPDCEVCAAARELEASRSGGDQGEITRTVEGGVMGQMGTVLGEIVR
jgi:hypothetical protein